MDETPASITFGDKRLLPEFTSIYQLANGAVIYRDWEWERLYTVVHGKDVFTDLPREYWFDNYIVFENALYCTAEPRETNGDQPSWHMFKAVLSSSNQIEITLVRDLAEDERFHEHGVWWRVSNGQTYAYRTCDDPHREALCLKKESIGEGISVDRKLSLIHQGQLITSLSRRNLTKPRMIERKENGLAIELPAKHFSKFDDDTDIFVDHSSPYIYFVFKRTIHTLHTVNAEFLRPLQINDEISQFMISGVYNGVMTIDATLKDEEDESYKMTARLPDGYFMRKESETAPASVDHPIRQNVQSQPFTSSVEQSAPAPQSSAVGQFISTFVPSPVVSRALPAPNAPTTGMQLDPSQKNYELESESQSHHLNDVMPAAASMADHSGPDPLYPQAAAPALQSNAAGHFNITPGHFQVGYEAMQFGSEYRQQYLNGTATALGMTEAACGITATGLSHADDEAMQIVMDSHFQHANDVFPAADSTAVHSTPDERYPQTSSTALQSNTVEQYLSTLALSPDISRTLLGTTTPASKMTPDHSRAGNSHTNELMDLGSDSHCMNDVVAGAAVVGMAATTSRPAADQSQLVDESARVPQSHTFKDPNPSLQPNVRKYVSRRKMECSDDVEGLDYLVKCDKNKRAGRKFRRHRMEYDFYLQMLFDKWPGPKPTNAELGLPEWFAMSSETPGGIPTLKRFYVSKRQKEEWRKKYGDHDAFK